MKKGLLVFPLLTSAILLGGCGNSQSNHSADQNHQVKTNKVAKQNNEKENNQNSSSESSTNNDEQQALWNQSKKQKLNTFMQQWGTTMKQQYKNYGPGNNTNFYGIAFPQQFDQTLLKVNDQTVSMKWSNDGTGNADYNVVAIYCDSDSAQPMSAHLYLFAFHDDEPVVLITQQTNGNVTKTSDNGPDDGLHFKETENQDLKNGFKAIVDDKTPTINGQKVNKIEQSSSSKNSDNQTDAPDDFPLNMQGTWYTYNKDEDKVITLTISDNKMTNSEYPSDVIEMHKITESEKRANQSNPSKADNSKKNWAYFNHFDGWINVYGWYQGAGDGSYYKVTNQNINGQDVPVLAEAGGADIHVDANYYRSKDLAIQQKDTTYPGQHTLDDDTNSDNN